MNLQKRLPLGVASFKNIVDRDLVLVDKTDLVASIAEFYCPLFLSRPRRFGKTTLTDTFHELFAHGLENFQGLKIEQDGLYTDDKTYPVLHFDFSSYTGLCDIDEYLQDVLQEQLEINDFDFNENAKNSSSLLRSFLLRQPDSSLVLLIDEYDAPLTDVLDNEEEFAYRVRVFQGFYALIKQYTGKFRFIFITGITRYSNTALFSKFNNLDDLTFNSQYGALLGYTQEELEFYFKDHIENAANVLNQEFGTNSYSYESVLQLLKQHYDGYCFDRKASKFVYNPWSILKFLTYPREGFLSYWLDTGAGFPTLVVKYLDKIKGVFGKNKEEHFLDVDSTIGVSMNELIQPLVDMSSDEFSFKAVLYQTGYLTIKSVSGRDSFNIGLPNLEVKQVYADTILDYLGQQVSSEFVNTIKTSFKDNLLQQRYDDVKSSINQLLNVLSYESVERFNESLFRDVFKLCVLFAGASNVQSEVPNASGRCDLMFTFEDTHFVCEFKKADSLSAVKTLIASAEKQISSRNYTQIFGADKVVALVIVAVNQKKGEEDTAVREIKVIKQVYPKA